MKKTLMVTLLGFTIITGVIHANVMTPNDLEPTINGGVSASGLFPNQELEDRFGTFNEDDIEPSLNGEVSASGLYPTQEIEDAVFDSI